MPTGSLPIASNTHCRYGADAIALVDGKPGGMDPGVSQPAPVCFAWARYRRFTQFAAESRSCSWAGTCGGRFGSAGHRGLREHSSRSVRSSGSSKFRSRRRATSVRWATAHCCA
ncbi:hypothetical protein ACFQ0G_38630 [Streptomyces chiangmaiensis]